MESSVILFSLRSNSDFDRNEANGELHRAWCIMAYCSIALKCLARFSAPPARAAELPVTDAIVYSS